MRIYPKKHIIEQKNLAFLIRAFDKSLDKKSTLSLVLVGDGNYRHSLETMVKNLDRQKEIIFVGYQTNIDQYLTTADIFVNPSHYEGMPNTVLEAMARGVFILCSDIPEHRFIIEHNKTGILFDQNNESDFVTKINNFYQTPEKYIRMAKNGRRYVLSEHSVKTIISKILKMYKQLSFDFRK
jgi:glycosyltransferase involved in cell wall biosynthesis